MTVRRGSRASTNGCSTSRLAPMPFISSSGGTESSVPGRTATRTVRPAAVIRRTNGACGGLLVIDVRAGRIGEHLLVPTERGRCRDLLAGALAQPRQVVRPPGALLRLGRVQPFLRVPGRGLRDLERRPGVARRVHQRRDVTAGREDEPA